MNQMSGIVALRGLAGLAADARKGWAAQAPRDAEGEADGTAALERAVRALGLHAERFHAPTSAALEALGPGRYLWTLDAEGEPLFLTEKQGDRVRVETGEGAAEWLDTVTLLDRLGLSAAEEHEWLAPEEVLSQPKEQSSPWRQVIDLVRPDVRDVWVIATYAMGVGVLSLALPAAVQVLVNTVAFGTILQPVIVLSILLAAGLFFGVTLRALQMWVVEIVQRRVFVRLVSALSDRLPRVHVMAFERAHGPELVNRFFDVFTAQKAVSSLLMGGIEAVLTSLVGLAVLAFYHPILLSFGGLILLGAAFVVFVLGRGATKTSIVESKQKYMVAGWLEEMTRHLFALKVSGGGTFARTHLDRLASGWLDARAAHFRIVFRQVVGTLGLQVVASVALLGVGGWLVIERELTIGQLVAAELIVTAVVGALNKLGNKLESAYDLVAAADKLDVLLSLPIERAGGSPLVCVGGASLRLVDATSDDGEIENLSMELAPEERVFVCGRPDQRRALTHLVFGMREPASGTVFVDGHDTRDVDLSTLRSRVAVVRSPEPLPASIADNLRAAAPHLSSAAIWELLERVGLGDTVRRLPEGLRTPLLATGGPLSTEDALRLTVARAIAADPALLVLDGVLDQLRFDEAAREWIFAGRTVVVLGRENVPGLRRVDLGPGGGRDVA